MTQFQEDHRWATTLRARLKQKRNVALRSRQAALDVKHDFAVEHHEGRIAAYNDALDMLEAVEVSAPRVPPAQEPAKP